MKKHFFIFILMMLASACAFAAPELSNVMADDVKLISGQNDWYFDFETTEGGTLAMRLYSGDTGEFVCEVGAAQVEEGTGRILKSRYYKVGGKTGTAQNRGHDHSVFMGFAPMNNPKIAIAVYVENGGFGAVYGVPIGALMMEQYLKGKLSPENEIRAEEYSNRVIMYGNEER